MSKEVDKIVNSNSDTSQALERAYKKTVSSFSNIAAILVIFGVLKDIKDIIYFIVENPILSSIILFLLVIVFVIHLLNLLNIKIRLPKFRIKILSKKNLAVIGGIVTSIALLITIIVIIFLSTTGVHYVWIASHKEPRASEVVDEIKEILKSAGFKNIEVNSYGSPPPNLYRSIIIGGPHCSIKSAEKTFIKVTSIIKRYIANDPKIYSYYLSKQKKLTPLKNTIIDFKN